MNYMFFLSLLSLFSTGCGQSPNPPILRRTPAPNPSPKLATNPFIIKSIDEQNFDNTKTDSITPAAEVSTTPVNLPEIPSGPTDGIMPIPADGMPRPSNKFIEGILPHPTDRITTFNEKRMPFASSNANSIDVPVSVGNYQIVYNDTLRAVIRRRKITPEEIRRMLEVYAKNGSATITKELSQPNGIIETVTLDLEEFISEKPNTFGDELTTSVKPISLPESQLPVISLGELLEAESNLQERIKELDAQIWALGVSYRLGEIPKSTRDENEMVYMERRKGFVSDLVAIQQDINSRIERVRIKESTRAGPQPFTFQQREVIPTGRRAIMDDIEKLARENRKLERRLRAMTGGPHLAIRQDPQTTSLTRPSSLDALQRELTSVRAQEINILNQIRKLQNSQSTQNSGALLRPVRWPNHIRSSVMSQRPGIFRGGSYGRVY